MNKNDERLNRLLRGAAQAPETMELSVPSGFVRRVLTEAYRSHSDELELAAGLVCQRVLLGTLAVMLGVVALSFQDLSAWKSWPMWGDSQARLVESVVKLEIP
jgi:hypothetical protein